jgi:hypothetical protein
MSLEIHVNKKNLGWKEIMIVSDWPSIMIDPSDRI